jgi:MoaA/NifB/PqqE/SkfB family radical SAM enzyme
VPFPEKIFIKQLDLELNGGCNYKCIMCPQSDGREKEFLKKLPFDVFKKILDDAMQYGLETVSLHGSGEPTLSPDMPKYVKYIKEKGLKCVSFTNGSKLTLELSKELIIAGIDVLRISCIGYDEQTYSHWMSRNNYNDIRNNIKGFVKLNRDIGGKSEAHLLHLIIDSKLQKYEIQKYRTNWSQYTGAKSEIWLMHNWAGSKVALKYHRSKPNKRSCGRPFSPLLQVRAGGTQGHSGAVVACCMVLGKDSRAVLGHLDNQTISEVLKGPKFSELRSAHTKQNFSDISYCTNCDQLYEIPDSLVWTDIEGREYGQSKISPEITHHMYS